jgi:hypothetical protein
VLTVVVMLATAWFGYGTVYMPVLTAAPGIRP